MANEQASVYLNGNLYSLAPDKSGKPAIIQGFVQRPGDDPSLARFSISQFPLGLGWAFMDRKTGRGVGGLLDATVDTGWRRATLGRLQETQVHASPRVILRQYTNFKGNLWGLFEAAPTAGGAETVESGKFGGSNDTWTAGGTVFTGGAVAGAPRAQDLKVHKGYLFAAAVTDTGATDNLDCYYSTDGVTWLTATRGAGSAGWTTYDAGTPIGRATTAPFTDDYIRLLPFGNTLLFAGWDEDGSGNIEVQESTNVPVVAATWAATLGAGLGIASRAGPRAFLDWYDLTGARSPVLVTVEGIYSLSLANDTYTLMYPMDGHADNGRYAEVGNDGALYVGLGSGDLMRLFINTSTGALEVMKVGPPGDGLVSARQGRINCILKTPSEWLLVAYGGSAASKNASIFKIDTSVILEDPETHKKFMPWHHVYQHATADLDIVAMAYSSDDDGTPRLHFAVEGASPDTGANTLLHIERALESPESGNTILYQTTSVLRFPDDDMGDPKTIGTFGIALIDAYGIGVASTNNYIQAKYGLNGASDDTTALGSFLSGTTYLTFGTGVTGKRIGIRLNFFQDDGSTSTTPYLGSFEYQAEKLTPGHRFWDFTIDIEMTVKENPPAPVAGTPLQETIITNLEAVVTTAGRLSFAIGQEGSATTNSIERVRVHPLRPPVFNLWIASGARGNMGYRTGFASFHVEESTPAGT